MDHQKPPFHLFVKDIPKETLEKQLGYVDPEKTNRLILDPELDKMFISGVQQTAACSPGTLGENLSLSPKQIDEAIHAASGNKGLQIRNIVCKWIEANPSRATVQALMEGLWNSDDIQTLRHIQGMCVASEATHDRKAEADVHAVADNGRYPPDLHTGSRHISDTGVLVQQAESPGYHRHPVVTLTSGVLAQRSHHTGSAFDRTDSTEEAMPVTPYAPPVIPYFLLQKPAGKPEERPIGLTVQKPSQASIPPRKTECVTPFTNTIQPKALTPQESFPNLVPGGAMQETSSDSSPQKSGEMVVPQQTSDCSQGASLSSGNIREQDIKALMKDMASIKLESSNHEKRIQQLEEEDTSKTAEIKQLQHEIENLRGEITAKDDQIVSYKKRVEELEQELDQAHSNEKEVTQALADEKKRGQEIQMEKDMLQKKLQQKEEQAAIQTSRTVNDTGNAARDMTDMANEVAEDKEDRDSKPSTWYFGKEIGSGGFAKVFLGHECDTGRQFAVKVISINPGKQSNKKLKSFGSEVKVLTKLKHKRIVTFFGSDEIPEDPATGGKKLYIYTEYMPGGSVGKHIQTYGALNSALSLTYTTQLLEGVIFLHERGVIHRDIKGDNLLRDSGGNIKLADFGCAKLIMDIVSDGSASISHKHGYGTPFWMAPETIDTPEQDGSYDFASDVWSVAGTVIEMHTGEHPYPKHNRSNIIIVLGAEEHFKTPMEYLPDNFPQNVITLLHQCFERQPFGRPSAKDLLCRIQSNLLQ